MYCDNTMQSKSVSSSSPASTQGSYRCPILYIEESIKCVRGDDTTRRANKYDTDWRIYVVYRYGKFILCGTRQPAPLTNKKKKTAEPGNLDTRTWPVVSLSFDYSNELYSYMKSLIGNSKVNATLFISETTGTALDDLFARPSHENLDILDAERSNRRMELVGYDRVKAGQAYYAEGINIVKQLLLNIVYMGHSQTGMNLSFTCSLAPVADTVLAPIPEPEPALEYQPESSGPVYSCNTPGAPYDEEYDYVYSGGTGSYTQTYDYPK